MVSVERINMFYENLIKLCNERGTTPTEVCHSIGLAASAGTKWKSGAVPRDTTLKKIADYFGVSVSYLLGVVDDPDPIALIDPSKKEPPMLAVFKDAFEAKAEVDMAMDKLTASLQEAMEEFDKKKNPSMLERLAKIVKNLSNDDLEELGRYADYLASKNK